VKQVRSGWRQQQQVQQHKAAHAGKGCCDAVVLADFQSEAGSTID
jgi:hypothetical protein